MHNLDTWNISWDIQRHLDSYLEEYNLRYKMRMILSVEECMKELIKLMVKPFLSHDINLKCFVKIRSIYKHIKYKVTENAIFQFFILVIQEVKRELKLLVLN